MEYVIIIAIVLIFKTTIEHFIGKVLRNADKVLSVVEKELDAFIDDDELIKSINEQHEQLLKRRKKD